jgi:hypothetical protein
MTNPNNSKPLEPVRVELTETSFYTRWPCLLCRGTTEKVGVLAEVQEGALEGFRVCENCLRRVAEGESLDAMLRERADTLLADARAEAEMLRSLVGRLQAPTYREWGRAMLEHDYREALGRCSEYSGDLSEDGSPRVARDDLRRVLLGGLTGDSMGAWSSGPAFELFAVARAVTEGHLTLEEVAQAAAEAMYPLRDGQRIEPPATQPRRSAASDDRWSKASLLAKYAEREPKQFVQMDAHYLPDGPSGALTEPDAEGDALTACETYELMRGAPVRVLIEPDCEPALAVRRLRKLADWLEGRPGLMAQVRDDADIPF